ncbi:hypothetical protein ASPCADRAFT_207847 [Aspergillus carbonarius ITEM 5010]|uniref:Clr5 domain-containing protein n=1 Tax=Aspergillus carbonarius (strain ITEM 5010) TaxID=602072 RepID=A0A1R3RLN1_ASPC5|nr:hypothetical protein ASPCADRAFT_207847 [Aspergillus carbonarius ITEM 5010]
MPRSIDLEPYKAEIISLFRNNTTSLDIALHLQQTHHLQVRERTIKARLSSWGVSKRNRTATSNTQLHTRISELFINQGLEERELLQVLQSEGFEISSRTLRRIRTRLGLVRRTNDPVQRQMQEDEALKYLREESKKGTIKGYGRGLLTSHMRGQGIIIARLVPSSHDSSTGEKILQLERVFPGSPTARPNSRKRPRRESSGIALPSYRSLCDGISLPSLARSTSSRRFSSSIRVKAQFVTATPNIILLNERSDPECDAARDLNIRRLISLCHRPPQWRLMGDGHCSTLLDSPIDDLPLEPWCMSMHSIIFWIKVDKANKL